EHPQLRQRGPEVVIDDRDPRIVGEAVPSALDHRRGVVQPDRDGNLRPGTDHQLDQPAVTTAQIEDALARLREDLHEHGITGRPRRRPTDAAYVLVDLLVVLPRRHHTE